jgi:DNA polymerase-3 subunit beta
MKTECVKNKLEESVNSAASIISKNLDLEILSSIYLNSENNLLKIKSTDIDTSIELVIPTKTTKPGTVYIPGDTFSRTINSLKDEESVVLEEKDGGVSVKTKNNDVLIKCIKGDGFPDFSFDENESENNFKIKIKDFRNCLRSVAFSSANSNIKPELSSVYLKKDPEELVFVTTDGYRLSEKKTFIEGNNDELEPALIPIKSVLNIIKVLDTYKDDNQEIIVYISNEGLYFRTVDEKLKFYTRLVSGNFPDYKQLLPKDKKTSVIALKKDLSDSLRILNIFSDEYHQIDFTVNMEDKNVYINSSNNNVGKTENILDSVIEGESVSLSFNHKYINEVLGSIETDSLELCFNGSGKPMVIKTVPSGDFKYLVMPINK